LIYYGMQHNDDDEDVWFCNAWNSKAKIQQEELKPLPYGTLACFQPKTHLDFRDPSYSKVSDEEFSAWQRYRESLSPDMQSWLNRYVDDDRTAVDDINHRATEIDGKLIANDIKATLATEISNMKNSIGKVPGLGVVLVGTRKDSLSFVRIKKKACEQVGIDPLIVELPEDCTESEVLDAVSALNYRDSVHGILVQLPLPSHMNEEKIINAVNVEKDVDGFHPINMGNLAMTGRSPLFIPCASRGCIEVLHRYGVEIIGKKAVVIGRSKITGLSTSLLLEVLAILLSTFR
ncbi:bifunctional protein FolD 1, mitochondrial-like protein isoform X1, partial [Tanacetum coccineum]